MVASTTDSAEQRLSSDKAENNYTAAGNDDAAMHENDDLAEKRTGSRADGDGDGDDHEIVYPGAFKLTLTLIALCISIFLVALDQTIIAPALGAITGQFQSTKDIVS